MFPLYVRSIGHFYRLSHKTPTLVIATSLIVKLFSTKYLLKLFRISASYALSRYGLIVKSEICASLRVNVCANFNGFLK